MKQGTSEDKIVILLCKSPYKNNEDVVRTTLTSYRNDVLEEVLAAFEEYRDPLNDCQNCGMPDSDKLRHLIKSLKVDIIKR